MIYKKKLFTFLDIIKQNIEKDSNQIKFKNAMVKSSLPHYNDAYILVKGTIAVQNTATAPPWWDSPCRWEGAYPSRSFNQSTLTRRVQLKVAVKQLGQQISSAIMSRPESILISQD